MILELWMHIQGHQHESACSKHKNCWREKKSCLGTTQPKFKQHFVLSCHTAVPCCISCHQWCIIDKCQKSGLQKLCNLSHAVKGSYSNFRPNSRISQPSTSRTEGYVFSTQILALSSPGVGSRLMRVWLLLKHLVNPMQSSWGKCNPLLKL